MSQCGAPMTGSGRSRKGKGRKMRGGNFYGFGVDSGLGSAGAKWGSVENVAAKPDGTLVPNNGELAAPKVGGRRRRTSKKGRKSRRVSRRRRTMRGGAGFYSIAGVGAGYAGKGAAGLADYGGYSTKGPVAGGPTQGADGVMRA